MVLQRVFIALGSLSLALLTRTPASAQAAISSATKPAAPSGIVSYRESIEPIFKASCASCHSATDHASGFNIETAAGLAKGGSKTGSRLIVAGHADKSEILRYLRGTAQPQMPMGQQPLPQAQIKLIAAWIDQGAKVDAVKLGWPYIPPGRVTIPAVHKAAWVRNPIDRFILAKLESRHLAPSPAASRAVLLRRVYADLVGVPPTPEEAAAFLNDPAKDAYEKLIDRLLADPRYGERWGRHWLDLVRYAETHGFENDGARPRAWRYRDYVIRAFNEDKPYDRFLKEQIAGDELYPNDPDALVATGYARLGPWDELSTDPNQRWQDYLNDVTDTTGSVMLGLTVGCARCHNHKYDQISQADYYRLQSFYATTHWADNPLPGPDTDPAACRKMREEDSQKLAVLRKERDSIRAKYTALAASQKPAGPHGEKLTPTGEEIDKLLDASPDNKHYHELDDHVGDLEGQLRPLERVAEIVTDESSHPKTTHLLLRGNLLTPGPEVTPGFVASLVGGVVQPAAVTPPPGDKTTGRRTALANWIASDTNPMTARVLVNRLWQHHFGQGIVGTPSDFGRNGDHASHPELLDWLAERFVKDGWSLKKMHRLMLTSSAYRQSIGTNPVAAKADPLNKLLWRMNRIRLEGETIRDSVLAVSGRLNPKMYGPGVYPRLSDEVLSTGSTHKWGSSPEDETLRRTVYVFQRRSLMLPLVEAYDGADMSNTCPRRSVTTIAPQALELFNGEFSREESHYFALRVVKEAGPRPASEIERAYRIAFVRPPTAREKALAIEFLQRQAKLHHQDKQTAATRTAALADADPAAEQAALEDLCHVLINTNEFVYLD